jgi:hypothetical protein
VLKEVCSKTVYNYVMYIREKYSHSQAIPGNAPMREASRTAIRPVWPG